MQTWRLHELADSAYWFLANFTGGIQQIPETAKQLSFPYLNIWWIGLIIDREQKIKFYLLIPIFSSSPKIGFFFSKPLSLFMPLIFIPRQLFFFLDLNINNKLHYFTFVDIVSLSSAAFVPVCAVNSLAIPAADVAPLLSIFQPMDSEDRAPVRSSDWGSPPPDFCWFW